VLVRREFQLPGGFVASELPPKATVEGPGLSFEGLWSKGEKTGTVVWVGKLLVKTIEIDANRYPEARRFMQELRIALRQGVRAVNGAVLPAERTPS
jgi:hypothetical protein